MTLYIVLCFLFIIVTVLNSIIIAKQNKIIAKQKAIILERDLVIISLKSIYDNIAVNPSQVFTPDKIKVDVEKHRQN